VALRHTVGVKILLLFLVVAVALCFVPRRFLGILKWPLVLIVVLAGFIVRPVAAFNHEETADESFDVASIATYKAHFVVDRHGDLKVTENVLVSFPIARHGIFRFFDLIDPSSPHARRIPEDISVRRDGRPEEVDFSDRGHGRFRVVRIGSPSVEITGMHTYTIRYRVHGVIEPGTTGERSQFYWNLIPGGWTMSIDRSTLTVDLPVKSATTVQCAVGARATSGCLQVRGAGTRRITVTTGHLEPRTPVTLKTGLDLPTPRAVNTVPWSGRWDPVLGRDLLGALVVALLVLVSGGVGWWWRRAAHEKPPGYPLMYVPPVGVGPAQAVYVMEEKVGRDQFVATVLYAAQRGAISLHLGGEGQWRLSTENPRAWDDLDVVTKGVGNALDIRTSGTLHVGQGKTKSGKKLQAAEGDLSRDCRRWAEKAGHLSALSGTATRGWLGVIALVVAVLWALINPFDMALMAAVPGAFGAFAAMLLASGAGTVRTESGRRLWSEVGGFKRMLSTDSSEARFDFSARKDLYTAYIPWAVAFGVADAWAKKYQSETGEPPPMPEYLPVSATDVSGSVGSTSSSVSALSAGFGAAVGAAIGAYTASIAPSSSSGGSSSSSDSGGGFSGGGGGGGGGGGSW
jgi:uncharacterized membrane protein YgcG